MAHTLPPLPLHHAGEAQLRQVGQRDHVDLHHLALRLGVRLPERAIEREPGVIDQNVDGHAGALQLAGNVFRRCGLRQIFRDDGHGDLRAAPQLIRDLRELRGVSGDQHEGTTVACKALDEFVPDPAARAGNQRGLPMAVERVAPRVPPFERAPDLLTAKC